MSAGYLPILNLIMRQKHLTKYRRAAVAANRCSPVLLRVQGCGARLKPKPGDCCVFCSYGSVPCPPIQAEHVGEAPSCCNK